MKAVKTIWDYFKSSWEGDDGKFSYKRATVFVFVWCMVVMALRPTESEWEFWKFVVIAILYGLQTSVITWSQLKYFLNTKYKKETYEESNSGASYERISVDGDGTTETNPD